MFIMYYKDKLSKRQNKPFVDYFNKERIKYQEVSSPREIQLPDEEVVHIFCGALELIELYFRYIFNRKIYLMYRARGIGPEESFYRNRNIIRFLVLSVLEYISICLSYKIIVVSNYQKKYYIKKYKVNPKKIFVLHNYFSSTHYKAINAYGVNKEIVYVGGISKWQKTEKIKEIFIELNRQCKDITFLICANETNLIKLEEYFQDIINISFESYDNYELLLERISKSTAGIIIRDANIVNQCSCPFKIIDYLSAQIPIIMTKNIGDYSELLQNRNFALIIDIDNDTPEIAQEIQTFLSKVHNNMPEIKNEILRHIKDEFNFERELEDILKEVHD